MKPRRQLIEATGCLKKQRRRDQRISNVGSVNQSVTGFCKELVGDRVLQGIDVFNFFISLLDQAVVKRSLYAVIFFFLNSRDDTKDNNPTFVCSGIFASAASFPSSWPSSFVSPPVFPHLLIFHLSPSYASFCSFRLFFLSPSHLHLLLSDYHLLSFSLLFHFHTFFNLSAFSFSSFHSIFWACFHPYLWAGQRSRYPAYGQRLATGWTVRGSNPVGARFSVPLQTGPGAHPAFCTMGTGSFPGVKSGRGVTLTPHPLLVPWS